MSRKPLRCFTAVTTAPVSSTAVTTSLVPFTTGTTSSEASMASITVLVSSTAPPVSSMAGTTVPMPFTTGTTASGGWRPWRASPPWCRPLHLRCRPLRAPPLRCRSRRAPSPPVAGVHGGHHRPGVVHCTSGVVHGRHHRSGAVHDGHHRLRWLASMASITALVSSTAPPVSSTAGTTSPVPFTAGTIASGGWRPRRASPPWCRPLHLRYRSRRAPPLRCRLRRAPPPPVTGVHGGHHRPGVVHCTSGVVHGRHHLSGAVHGGHHRLRWLASMASITALLSSTAPPVSSMEAPHLRC
ncbi:hypothetical protein V3C99_003580 [Haemonchus contortus]